MWILCLDDRCHEVLDDLDLPNVNLIRLQDFEAGDTDLLAAKKTRSLLEYYFTCTPSLPLYVFENWRDIESITYLDSDIFFFSSPDPVFDEVGENSVAMIEHRFSPGLESLKQFGIFNVGWITFRRDRNALDCLNWWRDRCNEWCYKRLEGDRFADQKYLDQWPSRFNKVIVLQHKGANLGPWNVSNYELTLDEGRVLVDGQPLVFFHFHGLMPLFGPVYDLSVAQYGVLPNRVLAKHIYTRYIRTLGEISRRYKTEAFSRVGDGNSIEAGSKLEPYVDRVTMLQRTRKQLRLVYNLLLRRYVIVLGRHPQ